jgi:hypothetical protein
MVNQARMSETERSERITRVVCVTDMSPRHSCSRYVIVHSITVSSRPLSSDFAFLLLPALQLPSQCLYLINQERRSQGWHPGLRIFKGRFKPSAVIVAVKATTPGFTIDLPSNLLHSPQRPSCELKLIRQAAQPINQVERPLIYAGHGVLGNPLGPKFLTQLVREGNIPVTTMLQGLGVFDETDPKSLHMISMHGSAYANIAMQQADVVIALGAHFDDRMMGKISQFAPAARAVAAQGRGGFIHFEILPKNIACHSGGSSGAAAPSRVESSRGVRSALLFQVPYKAKYR